MQGGSVDRVEILGVRVFLCVPFFILDLFCNQKWKNVFCKIFFYKKVLIFALLATYVGVVYRRLL